MKWTSQDSTAARDQGWDVYDIWDQDTQRMSLEIQRATVPGYFKTDELARAFVAVQDDPLCQKARILVFKSKIPMPKTKGKK